MRSKDRRWTVATLVAGIVLAAPAIAWSGAAAAANGARTHEIVISGLQYIPATLAVKRGDVVVWVNRDPFPHTATAPGTFDSQAIAAGRSWRFVPRRAGSYPYVCALHSNMRGVLEVR